MYQLYIWSLNVTCQISRGYCGREQVQLNNIQKQGRMRHPEKLHLTVNGKVWRVNAYIYIYIRLYIKAKNIVIRLLS